MTWTPVDPSIKRGCHKLSVLAPEFLYNENNDIGVPSFILSGAPFFHHSRTKLGTPSDGMSASGG